MFNNLLFLILFRIFHVKFNIRELLIRIESNVFDLLFEFDTLYRLFKYPRDMIEIM